MSTPSTPPTAEAPPHRQPSRRPDDPALVRLSAAWKARGVTVHDTLLTPRATVAAPAPVTSGEALEASLPHILGGASAQFALGTLLGEGGMGVVFTARQHALARDVAVKLPRATSEVLGTVSQAAAVTTGPSFAVRAQMVSEARTTGALEHPNIVPVHALGRDEAGNPVIVMKRIEGESWRDALDRELAATGQLSEAQLERHVGVLVQVAAALHYAHSRGVVHRDIKPENVMLGSFGEIYLVDWGLAVGVGAHAPGHLPPPTSVKTIVGTPAYMAPEMARVDGAQITARTDVYLLGAVLHELVTGLPPHDDPHAMDALVSAFESRPVAYPATVPAGLAAICHRAMAADPALRFADGGAFRDALAQAQQTAGSVLLTENALIRLGALRILVGRHDLAAAERERVRDLGGACSFGFAQALRTWPGNAAARAGLQETLELRIAYELARHAPDAAELLLAELPTPRPDLAARVQAAAASSQAESERLRRLERDHDVMVGTGLRARILAVYASVWFACTLAFHILAHADILAVRHLGFATMAVGACVLGAGVVWQHRGVLLATAVSRRMIQTYFVSYTSFLVYWVVAALVDAPFEGAAALMLVMSAGLWGVLAAFGDPLMAVMVPASLAGALLIAAWPELVYIWYAVTVPVGLVLYALLENRRRARLRASRDGGHR